MAEAATPKKKIEEVPEKLHVWPYLVRLEFLCALVVIIALTVWSIVIDAPLEEAANPTKTQTIKSTLVFSGASGHIGLF
ncbi:MAG: hypothetical protein Ct9H300mP23_03990 [Nitrospinota bacterium]|nr:MAG: hypothetical protein Ct9H300mP23_03990 [Nitrospinota bacterium]